MQEILEFMQEKMVPFDVTFELTYDCNLKCVHCYQDNTDRNLLSTEEIYQVLNDLRDMGCFNLAFTGGEIFLRKDIIEIIRRAAELDFVLRLFTNATLITKETAQLLSEFKRNIQFIEISVYGSTPQNHDRVTNKDGTFKDTMNAIKHLKENGIRVLCKTPIMTLNVDDFLAITKLCSDIEVKHSYSMLMYPTLNGNKEPIDYRINNEQMKEILEYDTIKNLDNINNQEAFKKFLNPGEYEEEVCGAATRILNITPTGNVTPCIILPTSLGNVKETRLKDIWFNSLSTKNFRKIVSEGYGDECKSCESFNVCSKCLGLSFLENGDYKEPSREFCKITETMTAILREKI